MTESNRIADEIRMKLQGKMWCEHCQTEVKPSILEIEISDWERKPTCPHCYGIVHGTKPKRIDTKHLNKEIE